MREGTTQSVLLALIIIFHCLFFVAQRSASEADPFSMEDFEEDLSEVPDLSVNHYPSPYCGIVQSLPTACFHVSSSLVAHLAAVACISGSNPGILPSANIVLYLK